MLYWRKRLVQKVAPDPSTPVARSACPPCAVTITIKTHHHRDRGQLRIVAQDVAYFKTVRIWHHRVQQDRVWHHW